MTRTRFTILAGRGRMRPAEEEEDEVYLVRHTFLNLFEIFLAEFCDPYTLKRCFSSVPEKVFASGPLLALFDSASNLCL